MVRKSEVIITFLNRIKESVYLNYKSELMHPVKCLQACLLQHNQDLTLLYAHSIIFLFHTKCYMTQFGLKNLNNNSFKMEAIYIDYTCCTESNCLYCHQHFFY